MNRLGRSGECGCRRWSRVIEQGWASSPGTLDGLCQRLSPLVCTVHHDCAAGRPSAECFDQPPPRHPSVRKDLALTTLLTASATLCSPHLLSSYTVYPSSRCRATRRGRKRGLVDRRRPLTPLPRVPRCSSAAEQRPSTAWMMSATGFSISHASTSSRSPWERRAFISRCRGVCDGSNGALCIARTIPFATLSDTSLMVYLPPAWRSSHEADQPRPSPHVGTGLTRQPRIHRRPSLPIEPPGLQRSFPMAERGAFGFPASHAHASTCGLV